MPLKLNMRCREHLVDSVEYIINPDCINTERAPIKMVHRYVFMCICDAPGIAILDQPKHKIQATPEM